MEMIKYFFKAYFNQSFGFDELDGLIEEFKSDERMETLHKLIVELHQIIQTKSYVYAAKIINKCGFSMDLSQTEQLIKYIYNKLTDQPATINRSDFVKDCKVIFCPVCTPDPEKAKKFSLIENATVIGKDVQIFICKPCKLVWLSEDIRVENAQDYKKFMKKLGLKGLWKELCDVDVL